MLPALLPGDRLVVLRFPWRSPFRPGPGQVVALRDPRRSDRILIKRIRSIDLRRGTLEVEGDSRQFEHRQPLVWARRLYRRGRPGCLPVWAAGKERPSARAGGVPSNVMTSHEDELVRILTSTYLDGMAERSLADIRAMRTECQEAEVALSYLRRLIQGRLDIVHTYLEHPGPDALRDLGSLVNDLPGILSSGPGRPPGPGHLPQLLSPDTEEVDLTAELDAVLGADEIGTLAELDIDQLNSIAGQLEAIETRVSADRRALHERIDALQAELVDRHKTGRATVDGLLK